MSAGLVDSDWGGTPVEAWSSPDALKMCEKELEGSPIMENVGGPSTPSVLWNAMIYPLLNMTIKGAVWYQGESNSGKYVLENSKTVTVLKAISVRQTSLYLYKTAI